MKFVIAPDSFKGSMSALEAAAAIAAAFREVFPESLIQIAPMADGGEGTLKALVTATGGTTVDVEVTGPMGKPIPAQYGVLGDGKTAIVEVANIAGLTMVQLADRDPEQTTTFGVGEAICHALKAGYRKLVVGLGGSATNDGGIGMLQALGAEFRDAQGRPVEPMARNLNQIHSVNLASVDPGVWECDIRIASDVTNPLCGPFGASAVFGPQKGATPAQVLRLDEGLEHYAGKVEAALGKQLAEAALEKRLCDLPGAGAAGGLGFALLALGARMESGARLVAESIGLEQMVIGADWVITGEGRSDAQTLNGKVPQYVAELARRHNVKALLLSGSIGDGFEPLYDYLVSIHSIVRGPLSLAEAMEHAKSLLFYSARDIARLIRASGIRGSF